MEDAGEPAWVFFERLRELRLRFPEVSLGERTVHDFCRLEFRDARPRDP